MPTRTRPRAASPRAGFTVTELLLVAALTTVLFAVALPFFHGQTRAIADHSGRAEAQLGARFALTGIERDLRAAGVGVVEMQPMLVEAGPRAITFNSDLVSRDSAFDGAVNFDPDAPAGSVGVLERTAQVNLPATGRAYPESTYVQRGGGAQTDSRAETISYWARRDSTSSRADEHVLFRRVNRGAPELVARGLVLAPTDSIFSYFKVNALGQQVPVQPDSLPLVHTAVHGGTLDRGRSALADSVRVVGVRLAGRSVDRRTGRATVAVVRTRVRLMNAGLLRRTTCGEAPLPATSLTAASTTAGGVFAVRLRWQPSADEGAGERDVERYLIYRRLSTDPPDFDEPLLSVAAGRTTYEYVDSQVEVGTLYAYTVVAQDCSPQNSTAAANVLVSP